MKKYYYLKCVLDFFVAFTAASFLLPIIGILSIVILIDSGRPVFFLQERLGQNGRVFKIYKFRTMVDGAIYMGEGLHTHEGDPRITKIGTILRKTSLDELPQIFNILKGEMSFIGPRPPVPYYPRQYDEYDETQRKRFQIKPGISGYAQVMVRNNATWDERIRYDVQYVDQMSLLFDIKTLFKTFLTILKRENIY